MGKLTIREVETMPDKRWKSDGPAGTTRMGSLVFRREGTAIHGYFRYAIGRTTKVYRIGLFDRTGTRGMTLAQLRDRAAQLARLRQEGAIDLAAHFAAEHAAQAREAEVRRQEEAAVLAALEEQAAAAARKAQAEKDYNLRKLCEAYVDHLEARGKHDSASSAASCFRLHLFTHRDLCLKPARTVTARELADAIRATSQAGKPRRAGHLRSFLSAAYTAALRAPLTAQISPAFLGFEIESNPVAAIPTIACNTRDRVLSDLELARHLRALFGSRLIYDLFLLLHVLSAGQRIQQLIRARVCDWDSRAATLRLLDPKGRRQAPREHLIPFATQGAALVELLVERAHQFAATESKPDSVSLFLSDLRDDTPLHFQSVGRRCRELTTECGSTWSPGDLRRTCETRLAALGVSRDIRAQLLSHGLGDLQTRHYDRHTWTTEKRQALSLWESHLETLLIQTPE